MTTHEAIVVMDKLSHKVILGGDYMVKNSFEILLPKGILFSDQKPDLIGPISVEPNKKRLMVAELLTLF